MVEKRRKLVPKPNTPAANTDLWVNSAGVDPEIQQQQTVEAPVEAEKGGKPYPHRLSFDMTTTQYRRLKRASFETDRSMNELLREAIEDWLTASEY